MPTNPNPRFHRRSVRLLGYDYTKPGAYFITICSYQKQQLFGKILNNEIALSPLGKIIQCEWERLPSWFTTVQLGCFSILPDHFHGLIYLTKNMNECVEQRKFGGMVPGSIPSIVRTFKSSVSRHARFLAHPPETPVWQTNYYEHIVRSMIELEKITRYIEANVERFEYDPFM